MLKIKQMCSLLAALFLVLISCTNSEKTIWLDEFDLTEMDCGWGTPQKNKSIITADLSIGGNAFQRGVGTHATSTFLIDLNGKGKTFSAMVGVDDATNETASVDFYVIGDKKVIWQGGVMKLGDSAKVVNVNIRGINKLGLLVTGTADGIRYDHADWADARFVYSGQKPRAVTQNEIEYEEAVILTPPAPDKPRINGTKIYAVRPGSPFLYRIPATGKRPMTFAVEPLPEDLQLDKTTGIITGKILKAGEYKCRLKAKNELGESTHQFKIVVGNTLALTPPMGWNSWYIHYDRISDSLMRLSADQMVYTGMADYGYQYVNIDDCWMVKANSDDPEIGGPMRDKNGQLLTNKRFPDMKAMTDYIHSKGLKAGTYISPGPTTCAGYAGSYQHEKQDAETFASWGFDFLKYDWCSYGQVKKATTVEDYKAPYKLMWNELKKLDRDIVLNLCQYGMSEVWKWGGEVGNSWRTTGDLGLESGRLMPGFYYIGISNAQHYQYARPGAWNDPDYILIGWVGNARKMGEGEKTKLTPNEQYFYMSMWSLMASPLIFSGDMAKLDVFTLNVLCNNEVIDINQDELGRQAKILKNESNELIMVKELVDGSKAVGLFHVTGNTNKPEDYFDWGERKTSIKIKVNASEIGVDGRFKVRDMWRQKDLGVFENSFEAEVPYHGVVFVKITQE